MGDTINPLAETTTTTVSLTSWTRLIGLTTGEKTEARSIAVDSNGNRYITGYTRGALGGQAWIGDSNNVFVSKYNASGTLLWTRLSGVAATGLDSDSFGIATDASGNAYITGETLGTLDTETLTGGADAFIMKYDAEGTKQWTKLKGVASAETHGKGISVDASGNVYVAGWTNAGSYSGALDGQTGTNRQDAFVTKYNSSGVRLWTKLSGVDGSYSAAAAITVDSSGNSYVTGYTQGNLEGQTLQGARDVFVSKYDTSGTRLWTKLLGAASTTTDATGIAVDSSGACQVTGIVDDALDGQTHAGPGLQDIFVAKYDTTGTKQWTRLLGSIYSDDSYGISVDSSGNSYVAGENGDTPFDGQTTNSSGSAFVTKYSSSGLKQWTKVFSPSESANETCGYGIAVDSGDKISVAGFTKGDLDGQVYNGHRDAFLTTKFNF